VTNNENMRDLVEEVEAKQHDSLEQLKFSASGQALIFLLQQLHDIVLKALLETPACEIHKVAEYQGKYRILNILLQRIEGDEDATSG